MLELTMAIVFTVILAAALAALTVALITRRQVARESRMLSGKEQALLENLAAGLAHELKNPLGTLNLNIQLLEEELKSSVGLPGKSRERLALIMKETQRLEDVLDTFLRYARRRPLALGEVDINALIEDVLTFLKPEIRRASIEVETRFDPEAPVALADAGLLKQALLNVLFNAVEAMPDGGVLTVTTRTTAASLAVIVTDEGVGVKAEDLPRVFDAYFSTRKGGTGLGLAITKRVIERHNGRIHLESPPGEGATVTLTLPLEGASAGT